MAKFYKQNYKCAGDKFAEDSSETNILHTVEDDGYKASRDIGSKVELDLHTDWSLNEPDVGKNWKLGPIKQGSSPPRYAPKGDSGTHQRGPNDSTYESGSAVSPSDSKFYKKKGGSGQRSGA